MNDFEDLCKHYSLMMSTLSADDQEARGPWTPVWNANFRAAGIADSSAVPEAAKNSDIQDGYPEATCLPLTKFHYSSLNKKWYMEYVVERT